MSCIILVCDGAKAGWLTDCSVRGSGLAVVAPGDW